MTFSQKGRLLSSYRTFARYTSLAVAVIGLLAICGWILDLPPLKSVLPGLATMKVNTALSFILSGIALWLIAGHDMPAANTWVARSLAALVMALALLTLGEYLFGRYFGIDQFFLRDTETPSDSFPGRMSITTAINFVLAGLALWLSSTPRWKDQRLSQFLALLLGSVALLTLIGYLYDVELLREAGPYSPMALPSTIAFLLLTLGICSARPENGLMKLVAGDSIDSEMIRRLLSVLLGLPVILGWLSLWGVRLGLYDMTLGFALMVILTTLLLSLVVWWNSVWLRRIDQERKQAEEQLLYQARLLRHVSDAVIATDETLRITSWNRAAESMYGWKAEEVIGRSVSEVVRSELTDQQRAEAIDQLQDSLSVRSEGRHRRKDGELLYVEANTIALVDEQNSVTGFLSVNRNITERKLAEAAVAASQKRFQVLVEHAPDGIALLGSDGKLRQVTPSTEKILGYSLSDVQRQDPASLTHPDDLPNLLGLLNDLIQNPGKVVTTEYRFRHKDGSWRWLESTISNLLAEPGVDAIVFNYRDVTERRQAEEKDRFQANLVASVADAIIATDMQLNIQGWNTGAEMMYGWKAEEVIGQPAREILDTDFLEYGREEITKQILEQGHWQGEVRQLRRNGSRIPALSSVSLYRDSEGQPAGIVAVNRDITDHKRAQEELRRLNEQLEHRVIERTQELENSRKEIQAILDSMSTLNAKVALDGTLLFVNKIAAQAAGLLPDQLMQTNFLEGPWWSFDPDVQRRVRAAFANAASGVTINYDERIFVFGQELTINFSLTPMHGENGRVQYVLAEGRDITRRIQTEEEIRRLNQDLQQRAGELEAVNKELRSFSYSVSHDLRAPLRAINGFSHALIEDYQGQFPEGAQDYLQRIQAAAARMGELVDSLLSLSRVTQTPLDFRSVNLSALAEKIILELQRQQSDRQVTFSISRDLIVNGDLQLLRIALENLIGNAWKFTSKREVALIEIGTQDGTGEQVYFVRDNGAGFDMAYKDKLFGTFQRLHTADEYPGTGIGLATVQRIINRHAGRIWAESELDRGTTVYFTLGSNRKAPPST